MSDGKDKEVSSEPSVPLRVPEELHKAAVKKMADLGGVRKGWSFQKVLRDLLRQWVDGTRTVPDPETSRSSERHSEDVKVLTWILENGTADDRQTIRSLLRNFTDAVQGREHKPASKRAGK